MWIVGFAWISERVDIVLCVDIRTCGCWVLCGYPHLWILSCVWISACVDENCGLVRGFAQWQHLFSRRLTGYAGVYAQYFKQSDEVVLEPRASLKYDLGNGQSLEEEKEGIKMKAEEL